jgi:uncharacterized protein DUF6220
MAALRTAHKFWAALLLLAVVVQVGLAGIGAFHAASKLDNEGSQIDQNTFEDGFGAHVGLGYVIFLGGVVLLILALAGRVERRRRNLSIAISVLLLLQIILAWIGPTASGGLGFFHPLNAFVILALNGALVQRLWREPEPVAAPAP